jgi:nitrogen fixation/metabolism regulation signal transduction histidine kinase
MTFRWRLILALFIAGMLPLIPLLLSVRSAIRTGMETLAPEETGLAIQNGLEFVRIELQTIREDLPANLQSLIQTVPPPAPGRQQFPHIHPQRTLYINTGTIWHQLTEEGWTPSAEPPEIVETGFGQFPIRMQERMIDSRDLEWVLVHDLPETFRLSAQQLQIAAADWAVSNEQTDRLINSLTATYVFTYIGFVLFAILAGLFVLSPLIRRISHLTDVAESIRTGNEDVRAIESGGGETQRLARTFNLMLTRLVESRTHAAEMEKRAAWRELAPVLAHEIKNPLTPIQLSVQQIAESYSGDDDRFAKNLRATREIVDEEVERLRRLVRDFGDFARAPEPIPEPVFLPDFVADLAGLYGERVEVNSKCEGESTFDREQVRRALVNLIDNALAAADEDDEKTTHVRFTCGLTNQELRFTIEDNGPGVSEESRTSIFEPYVTTKSNGIGLGLPVVKTTAENHGGRVWVERSEDLGGARFIFLCQQPAK